MQNNNNEAGFMKILKWAGIAALVAIPLVVFLKKRQNDQRSYGSDTDDEGNIFVDELEG